ncbi:MAG: response regulator [Candidatus Coatesbacteria bacterium]|nr:response regulator [Candidatus Coatesbacteria bacterium]
MKDYIFIEDLPVMVLEMAPDGRVVNTNEALSRSFGYSRDELVSLNIADLVPESQSDRLLESIARAVSEGTANAELILQTKAGRSLHVRADMLAVRGPDGGIAEITAFLTDITQKRLLEEQLLQAQKMSSVGLLTAGVAHDFNNILATILLASQMINMEVQEDSVLKRQAKSIQSSAESGAELASQLLSFAGSSTSGPRIVSPNDLVNDIANLSKPCLDNSISIEFHLDPNVRNIVADRNQIAQVVLNLALNAKDAMKSGGTLTFTTEDVQVAEGILSRSLDIVQGDYVRISVSDTGEGIDEENITSIFEPFFTTKDSKQGTGLGLSVALGIIRKYGGGIDVKSKLNEGTTFALYIPSSTKPELARVDNDDMEALCGSEHILVVDDRDEVRSSASQMLELWGYRVSSAADGIAAIEMYKDLRSEVDALLMDLRMPGIDGIETHRRLKEIDDSVVVVLTSGYGLEQLEQKASSQGVAGFIKKPYKIEQLLSLLRRILDGRRAATGNPCRKHVRGGTHLAFTPEG